MQSVGYLDPSSFRRLFRKKTGLTPLEYRCRFSRRVSAFQLNLARKLSWCYLLTKS